MFFLCHCTDTEKKMLLSKLRKASGIGKSIESQTSKRDVSTSTEDLGLFASISSITLSALVFFMVFQFIYAVYLVSIEQVCILILQVKPFSFYSFILNGNKRMKCFYWVSTNKICLKQKKKRKKMTSLWSSYAMPSLGSFYFIIKYILLCFLLHECLV